MTGSGTSEDPYIISNVTDLQAVHNNLGAYYELANDIDASATSGWNDGAGFSPIGLDSNGFYGNFNGKGYRVKNLYINRPTTDRIGLFSYVNLGSSRLQISNLGLVDCNVTGQQYTGGLAGRHSGYYDAETIYCYVTGTVCGKNYTGLVAGHGGNFKQCYASGNVTVNGSGNLYAGGFIGRTYEHIENCFSRVNVIANGGLYAGGFVGTTYGSGGISYSYSTGTVTGSASYKYGFCGYAGAGVGTCFWDTETSGIANDAGATGKTTAQMRTKATFTDANWDFTTIWHIYSGYNNGYPYLLALPLIYSSVYPSDAITRVTGLHHIYNPGIYRLGIQLGDVSNTIEIVEREARKKIEEPKPVVPEPYPDVVPWPEPTPPKIPEPFPDVVPWPEEKPKEPSWWSTITPWKEEYGETFGKEVAERWRAITPWKEEKGETFGKEVSERWRAVTPWKEEKGETFVSAIKKIFKKPPKPPKPPDSYSPYFEGF